MPDARFCVPRYPFRVNLSIVLITHNEEANLPRTLDSVMPLVRDGQGEIVVVDSDSTDRTLEIARAHGAKVLVNADFALARDWNHITGKVIKDPCGGCQGSGRKYLPQTGGARKSRRHPGERDRPRTSRP